MHRIVGGPILGLGLLCLSGAPAWAQLPPPPNELAVSLGAARDQSLSLWDVTVAGALSWDWDAAWRAAFVIEGELWATSEAEACRVPFDRRPENCYDGAVLAGLRFRRAPHDAAGLRPFVSVLLGSYFKGSGSAEEEFASGHFAVQGGVGAELRWPGSIQGLRVSLDYRRVVSGGPDRNQVRLLGTYVLGPRRFTRRLE